MAAPWVIMCRIPDLGPDDDAAEEDAADFSVSLRAPPRVSFLTAARDVHPNNPAYIDPRPYLLAAGPNAALLRFAVAPGADPRVDRVLVVARHFLPAAGGQATSASADLIPRRAAPMPDSYGVGTVGLLSLIGGDDYVIADLKLEGGRSGHAKLLLFFAGGDDEWIELDLPNPLPAQNREWVSVGVVSHDGDHLWWVDLTWGLISCDPIADAPALRFHALPPGRVLYRYNSAVHDYRCVCESDHRLRFVEVTRGRDSRGREVAAVSMWTRIPAHDGSGETAGWDKTYEMNFTEIWNDDSYKATQLPATAPAIVLVSPSNPNLVYFFLETSLFGVDVPAHQVVEFLTEHQAPVPPSLPVSQRHALPWVLPPSISDDLVEIVELFEERRGSRATTPESSD